MWGTFVVEQKMFISGFKDLKKIKNNLNLTVKFRSKTAEDAKT